MLQVPGQFHSPLQLELLKQASLLPTSGRWLPGSPAVTANGLTSAWPAAVDNR